MSRTERFDDVGRSKTRPPVVDDVKVELISDDETGEESVAISENLDHLIEIKDELIEAKGDECRNQVDDPSVPKPKTHLIQCKYQSSSVMNKVHLSMGRALKNVEQIKAPHKLRNPPALVGRSSPNFSSLAKFGQRNDELVIPVVKLNPNSSQVKTKYIHLNDEPKSPPVVNLAPTPQPNRKSRKASRCSSSEETPSVEEFMSGWAISGMEDGFGGVGCTGEQKDLLILRGKPLPKVHGTDDRSKTVKSFVDGFLEKVSWLTANLQINKFLCWPCFLFARDAPLWWLDVEMSSKQLPKFNRALEDHQNSLGHMKAHVQLKLRQSLLKKALPPESKVNDVIRRNRRLLKLLFQVTCLLKRKIDNVNPNFDGYADVMRFVSSYDDELFRFSSESEENDLAGKFISKYAQPVVLSIEAALKARVTSELSDATYVSVILEDTSDFVDNTYVAVIVRHVDSEGEIRERFVQFIELDDDRSAASVLPKFKDIIKDLALETKLVGFTYSGTVVAPKDIIHFNAEVSKTYPSSKFFHHHGHSVKRLLIQAMSHIKSCKNFFRTMADMLAFFETHPIAANSLMSVHKEASSTGEKCSQKSETDELRNGLVSIVKSNYSSALNLFDQICNSPNDWDSNELAEASSFLSALKLPQHRFLLCTAAQMMVGIEEFADVVENRDNLQEWRLSSRKAVATLNNIKKYGFKDILLVSSNSSLTGGSPESTAWANSKQIDLFIECISAVTDFIANYFKDLEYSFFEPHAVAVSAAYKNDRRKVVAARLNLVTDDLEPLIAQMDFLGRDQLFKGKSPVECLRFIIAHDMTTPLAEAVKFLRIQCTIPTKDTKTSTLEKLREYTRNKPILNSTDALFWMEGDLLETMEKEAAFYEDLIDVHFLSQDHAHAVSFKFKTKTDQSMNERN